MEKNLKRKFGEAYIKWRIRTQRGSTFTSEIDNAFNAIQRAGIVAIVLNTYFHVLIPFWILPVIWLVQKVLEYFLGWLDEKHLRWWSFETHYTQNNPDINPFQHSLMEKITDIQSKLK